ncbi:MAG: penicillin-binding protein 2 [Nitrospina sp.]|nr:penicillin-binding protein 2 [Nitrospina sp.]MBT6600425.1 penicillin-binding protein 2 [Nitrospina sp.]
MRRNNENTSNASRRSLKVRLILVSVLFVLFASGLVGRLFFLQIIKNDDLVSRSKQQHQMIVKINHARGFIYDRNMNELAANIKVESVYATPQEVKNKKKASRFLAKILKLDERLIFKKMNSKRNFIWVKRKISPSEMSLLRNDLPIGVNFISEDKRFFPKRELASGIIGFTGIDNQGLAGIEHQYDMTLKGNITKTVIKKDARGKFVQFNEKVSGQYAENGGMALAIDEVIQFFAEQHLSKQIKKYHAKSGVAIVMNPNTGEIYAIANMPQYNPNNYSSYEPKRWINGAVSNAYEPGSIFKPILAAAAIDSGTARPHDIFFCEDGRFSIGGNNIGEADGHKYGWLTLQNIISKSSNIGSVKVAQQLGKNSFYDYIRKFGFGQKTGVDLPGEAAGRFKKLEAWDERSLASISFGQEISATPLQLISAISAIANGGTLMTPLITQKIIKNGRTTKIYKPKFVRRVISTQTSRQMIDILKHSVKKGTGGNAAIKGYEVAGKTGTAQKYDRKAGRYSKTAYVSSFLGFVPADAAKIAILVLIDEPKGVHWGGSVAAPVFKDIGRETLRYLNVPSSDQRVYILDRA